MNKYTFVMRCDAHIDPDESYVAHTEGSNRITAANKAKVELVRACYDEGTEAGKIYILVVFDGHVSIDGFGHQTGRYEVF